MSSIKNAPSTQRFIEIKNINEHAVFLSNGYACSVIEGYAVNFDLLAENEQKAKLATYASFLNSLSFSIQIVIRNRREDVSSYLALLDEQAKTIVHPNLASYLKEYQQFVRSLVKQNGILDKKCYIVVSYSGLEEGARGVVGKTDFAQKAKQSLATKVTSLLTQLAKLALPAKLYQKNELIKLYYEIYSPATETAFPDQKAEDMQTTLVEGNPDEGGAKAT